MAYDTGLADRLRKDPSLTVKEIDGWRSRSNGSSSFNPVVFVRHHTAGPPPGATSSKTPSLSICVNGRPDLGGPLCNLYIGFDGVVYVVAAGPANHAGTPDGGSYKGATGNSTSYGLEIEHPGTSPLPAPIHEISARACAATIRGSFDESQVCDHKEWAPSRKIDLATSPTPAAFRELVAKYLAGEAEMTEIPSWFWDWSAWYLNTTREPDKRPQNAPQQIPQWAWDYNKQVSAIANNHGMTQGERDWIDWQQNQKHGPRPDVPQTIPEFWWYDNKYVADVAAGK